MIGPASSHLHRALTWAADQRDRATAWFLLPVSIAFAAGMWCLYVVVATVGGR